MSEIQIPSHISQVFIVCRYELLKFIRGKKMLGILAITIAIGIPLILMPELSGTEYPPNLEEFLTTPLSIGFFLIVLTALFFGGDSLITEFHQRTGYSLFINPVSKNSVWFGKFLAAELVSFLFIGLYYAIISSGAYVIYNELKFEILSSLGISLVVVTMIMSLAFLISSFLKGPTGAAVLIFFLFILVLPMFDQLLINVTETKPWFTPSFSATIRENVIFVPYPSDFPEGETPRGPFDHHRFVAYIEESLVVMFTYIIMTSLISLYIFKRKEMT